MKPYPPANEIIDMVQTLKDAGCDNATIANFVSEIESGNSEEGKRMLERHRRCLLENLHKDQKQIDCLDYFLYMMQKKQNHKIIYRVGERQRNE